MLSKSSKPNYELLKALPENLRKIAIYGMYRESLLSDPKIADEFLSSVRLTELAKDNLETTSSILKSISNSFPEEFEDNLYHEPDSLSLKDEQFTVISKIEVSLDKEGNEWILFYSLVPMLFEIEDRDESLESHLNNLNSKTLNGAWINIHNSENGTDNIALVSGFTMMRKDWTLDSDLYASNLMIQLLASIMSNQTDVNTISKSVSQQKMRSIEFENTNHKTSEEIITKSLTDYRNRLRAELQAALSIEAVEKGYIVRIPLKGHIRNAFAELYIIEHENDIMGKGMLLGACLPGMLGKVSSIKMANRLNFDTEEVETIHTTPKLAGAWHSTQLDDDSEWFNLYYNSFIPFNEPSNFNRFMHIEGLVREVTTSWPKVDNEIQFNSIISKGAGNV